ncbi:FecR domain-containing protein [Methylorubrum populi]|uniref:FecR family protein n=1 Tax=Methylorubrum rhodesianum TaxID=29427 RepID=UPI00190B0CC8|nr:FecR domain-containing protein [Methylorubrum rhodesianum]MBK3402701.1 FecR domain-containing protein [Methylorubrum rhodesianum]MBY0143354.1 FecR domain-containing protein [Methylorubrum populi]
MAKARRQADIDDSRIDESGRAAIKWMVALSGGQMTERQLRELDLWRNATPSNAEAWRRISGGLQPFDILARSGLPRGTVSQIRGQMASRNRRAVLGGLVGLIAVGGVGTTSLQRFVPLQDLLNDRYTRTAEHDRFELSDGSKVVLAPRSSINVSLQPNERRIEFVAGRMMLDVSERDPRPFVVDLGSIRLDASPGTFVLDRRDARLTVSGLKGSGILQGGGRQLNFRMNERLSYDGAGFVRSKIDSDAEASWTTGFAVFDDESVANIVELIRPYYAGFIRLSPEVTERRVTGVFNLFEPIVALDTLARSIGLKMTQTAGIWIKIEA